MIAIIFRLSKSLYISPFRTVCQLSLILLATTVNPVHAQACDDDTVFIAGVATVATEAELNAAVDCFIPPSLLTPGSYTIQFVSSITLTNGTTPINNPDGFDLTIDGEGNFLDGPGESATGLSNPSAFSLSGFDSLSVQNIYIQRMPDAALSIGGVATALIDNVFFLLNGGPGLVISGETQAAVSQSLLSTNGGDGIKAEPGSSITIGACNISGNLGNGVFANMAVSLVIDSQTAITNNALNGVHAIASTDIRISNSYLFANGNNGLFFENSQAKLQNVLVTSNSESGLRSLGASTLELDSSTFTGNSTSGITIDDLGKAILQNSTVHFNSIDGVVAAGNARVSISNSTITDHFSNGIVAASINPVAVLSTIVADNINDCSVGAVLNDLGSNYSSTPSCPGFTVPAGGVILGNMQDNGCLNFVLGTECVYTLQPDIVAMPEILFGDCNGDATVDPLIPAITVDQRGFARNLPCYAGAVEPDPEFMPPVKVLASNQWYQIGLPADPGANNTVAAIIGDDLPMSERKTTWAMYRYQQDPIDPDNDGYVEMAGDTAMKPGEGYWIKHIKGVDIELDMPAYSTPNSAIEGMSNCYVTDQCYYFTLIARPENMPSRFNMFAYPYVSAGDFAQARVQGPLCTVCTPTQAQAANVMGSTLFRYGGSDYDEVTEADGQLNVWDGFWSIVRPGAQTGTSLIVQRPTGG